MNVPDHIFKAYDIRGLVDKELTDDLVRSIGQAFVQLTDATRVAVGHDMRDSSPRFVKALIEGLTSMGADVVDIGLCSSPMLYFAVGMDEAIDGGIMVTASHNPVGWNGLKLIRGNNLPIHGGHGMETLRDLVKAGAFVTSDAPGTVTQLDTKQTFLDAIFSYVPDLDVSHLKIAADAGNGMNGMLLDDVYKRLGVEYEALYFDLDGTFPNHEANPLKLHTLVDLQGRVQETGADIGFAYDADGDRIGVIDEKGNVVSADILAALLVPSILEKHPGTTICGNVQTGRDLRLAVERAGGTFELTPVGHSKIKHILLKNGGAMAVELSGHFFFADYFRVESTVLTTLLILQMLAKAGRPLSELAAEVHTQVHSGEINFKVQDKQAMMDALKERYAGDAEQFIAIDGYRCEFADWWFGIRASNTEPVLRLNVEAASREVMEARRDEMVEMITKSEHGGPIEH